MKKVLIVEDDPFILDLTSAKLSEKYEVTNASNGEEALAQLSTKNFDAVLLDLDLPDVSGLEILSHIKKSESHKDLHVIIFSNNDDEVVKKQVTEMGIDGFFVKASTELDELLVSLENILSA